MPETYRYVRTSRPRVSEPPGNAGVNGAEELGHWGVVVQPKYPAKCSAKRSLCYVGMVSDVDAVRAGWDRRPGVVSATHVLLDGSSVDPQLSFSIAWSDVPYCR